MVQKALRKRKLVNLTCFQFSPQEVNLVAKLAKLGFGQFESDLGPFESELGNETQNQNQKRLAERVLR